MALTTLAATKTWLGIPAINTDSDATLNILIAAVSDWFELQTRRSFDVRQETELFSGQNQRGYSPKRTPVISVELVEIDGVAQVVDEDYKLIDDRVELLGDVNRFDSFAQGRFFSAGRYNCKVVYTAGYAVTPPAVDQAVKEMIALAFRGRDRIGLMSRSSPQGESVTFRPDQIPLAVQSVIDLYRAVVVP